MIAAMVATAEKQRVGTLIKKRRQELGWKQPELAERVGVSKTSVTKWETGRHYPGRYLGKLEAVLGISLDWAEDVYTDPDEAFVWSQTRFTPAERRVMIAALREERRRGAS